MNVFTYGSLMYADVWREVVKADYENCAAHVRGFSRRCVKNETYPGVIKASTHVLLHGRLYFDVNSMDINRLDHFEGEYYRRESVVVVLGNGERVKASIYLFRDEFAHLLDERPWNEAWFEQHGLAKFLSAYRGFMGKA